MLGDWKYEFRKMPTHQISLIPNDRWSRQRDSYRKKKYWRQYAKNTKRMKYKTIEVQDVWTIKIIFWVKSALTHLSPISGVKCCNQGLNAVGQKELDPVAIVDKLVCSSSCVNSTVWLSFYSQFPEWRSAYACTATRPPLSLLPFSKNCFHARDGELACIRKICRFFILLMNDRRNTYIVRINIGLNCRYRNWTWLR